MVPAKGLGTLNIVERYRPEVIYISPVCVVTFNRNQWSLSTGIRGHFGPEYAKSRKHHQKRNDFEKAEGSSKPLNAKPNLIGATTRCRFPYGLKRKKQAFQRARCEFTSRLAAFMRYYPGPDYAAEAIKKISCVGCKEKQKKYESGTDEKIQTIILNLKIHADRYAYSKFLAQWLWLNLHFDMNFKEWASSRIEDDCLVFSKSISSGEKKERRVNISKLQPRSRIVLESFLESLFEFEKKGETQKVYNSCHKLLRKKIRELFPDENIAISLRPIRRKKAK
ncbi:hypothetical protein [Desulfonatronum thiodismutans]|uniref:hypothetical protein n=1 Tax=Desulfonatronum thiodismutans TaxID=159290 RepID=UPI0004ABD76C|nr:hypothetical protein [Desulfonatronum thiodismutans]